MFPIPKIIHLSYKSKQQIPEEWINVIPAWERTHKDGWEIKFWSDSDNDALIEQKFPWFLDTYKNFKYKIQKCDAVRACYLYEYGGVYVDMDYMPLKNLEGLFENTNNDLYFTTSATVSYFTNSFMASKQKQEFWIKYLQSIIDEKIPWYYTKHFNVMYSTGPMKIDRLIRDSKQIIGYIPAKVLHPCTVCNKQCDVENVYLRVLEGGSWNSMDSKLMNYVFCNWKDILLYSFLILSLIIIYIKYFKIKNDNLTALNKCIFY
jgi:mannosyltransferase OCH1-like enzyme